MKYWLLGPNGKRPCYLHQEQHSVVEMFNCSVRFTYKNLFSTVLHSTVYLYNMILILHKKYPVRSANS